MGVTKELIHAGDGQTKPSKGDTINMEYTGWVYDASKPGNKGSQFDTSTKRPGTFDTAIGVGRVIKGWDEGVLTVDGGMTLGEKCTLTITPDYGYGAQGFPGLIPANSTLVFDVELKGINGRRA